MRFLVTQQLRKERSMYIVCTLQDMAHIRCTYYKTMGYYYLDLEWARAENGEGIRPEAGTAGK